MKKFALFFLFISFAYVYLHIYVANFFSKAGFSKNYSIKVFLLLALVSVLTLFLRRRFNGEGFEAFYLICFVWMGYILILAFFALIGNLAAYLDIEFKKIFISSVSLSVISLVFSLYGALKLPDIKFMDYSSSSVKRNYKLAFISDIHLDFGFKNKIFLKIIDRISIEKPDLLIIAGDLLDPGFKMDDYVYRIKNAGFPVIFVFGNHEYYYGLDKSQKIAKELGLIVLKDSSFVLDGINFIGISDIKTEDISLEEAKKTVSKEYKKDLLNIILSHQPLYFEELSNEFDFFMLSGHTHCGQIFPFHIFAKAIYPNFCGGYENKNSLLYVSKGAGTWGPPLRFLSNSEILVLNIKKR